MTNNEITMKQMSELFNLLDRCRNTTGNKLSRDARARIFAAIEHRDPNMWADAKSILITKTTTLWQAVVSAGVEQSAIPTAEQIITAIRLALEMADAAGSNQG